MILPLVPRGGSLIDKVVHWLGACPEITDYSSCLVVFPGRRPSHFLRKAVAERVGRAFIPPAVLSMDEFVDERFGTAGGAPLEAIDAAKILYEIQLRAPDPLGTGHFMTPDAFLPLGLRLFDDLEELCIEAVPVDAVRRVDTLLADELPPQAARRLGSLSFFYDSFYEEVRRRRSSTRSLRYRAVADEYPSAGSPRKTLFAGFFALTRSEEAIFRRLIDTNAADFLFQDGPGVDALLARLGIEAKRGEGDRELPPVHFYSSPDVHGEVFALSRLLEEKFSSGLTPDTDAAVVVPDAETLFPLLHHGLPLPPDGDINVSMGYPLSRSPLYGFLNSLMELLSSMEGDRFYLPAYLDFLLHPYVKNIFFNGSAEATRIMVHAVEQHVLANRTRSFITLGEILDDGDLLQGMAASLPGETPRDPSLLRDHIVRIHDNTLGRFRAPATVGEFAEGVIGIVTYIAGHSTARLHPLFHPFAEALVIHLHDLAGSLMRDLRFAEITACFTFLRRYIARCTVPFHGTPLRGLQVLGFLETRNLAFGHLFILDVNDDILPGTHREDSLLPFGVREALGLPTHLDRERLARYYFDTLLGNAGEVHIFFQENGRKERSRFVESLLWKRQQQDRRSSAEHYVSHVRYRLCLDTRRPSPVAKTAGVAAFLGAFSFSASALDSYLACPLQFYYTYVLGLGERKAPSPQIEKMDVGTLVHAVLADYFRPLRGRPLADEDLRPGRMKSLVAARCAEAFGPDPRGAAYLLQRRITARMDDLLTRYYRPLVRGGEIVVLDVERKIETAAGAYRLRGRIDRIEKRGERTVIIDYKTGANDSYLAIRRDRLDPDNRRTWPEAIGSLQLPFYMMLFDAAEGAGTDRLDAMFLLLGKMSLEQKAVEAPLFGEEGNGGFYESLRKIILALMAEITDGDRPFEAAADLKETCPDCAFRYLCGTQWIPPAKRP